MDFHGIKVVLYVFYHQETESVVKMAKILLLHADFANGIENTQLMDMQISC
jgi:hypothetical protein